MDATPLVRHSEVGRKELAPSSPPALLEDGSPIMIRSSFPSQLLTSMQRQLRLKQRMPLSTCMEIVLPLLFILGLVGASFSAGIETRDEGQFVRNPAENETAATSSSGSSGPARQQPILFDAPQVIRRGVCRYSSASTKPQPPKGTSILPFTSEDDIPDCGILSNITNTSTNPPQFTASAQGLDNLAMRCGVEPSNERGVPLSNFCVDENLPATIKYMFGGGITSTLLLPFDDLVLLQWAWRLLNKPTNGIFIGQNVQNILMNSGQLFFTPKSSPHVKEIVAYMNHTHWTFKHVFNSSQQYETHGEAASYLTSLEAEGKGWAAVKIGEVSSSTFEVDISMNRSASFIPTFRIRDRFTRGLGRKTFITYYLSGFLSIQSALTGYYAQTFTANNTNTFMDTAMVPMPYPSYKDDLFLQIAGRVSPLVLVLSFLFGVSQLTKRLVEEKELRLREAMYIMGLGKPAFFTSWILVYVLQALMTSILITIVLAVGLLKESDPTLVFICYFLFQVSTITFSTLLSCFFSKSRICALVAPIIYFVCSVPSFALPDGTSANTLRLVSFLSPAAFAQATTLLFQYETTQGMGWKDIWSTADTINMGTTLFMLLFDTILYLLLALYADAVVPNEWGTRSHPLFCILTPWRRLMGVSKEHEEDSPYVHHSHELSPTAPRSGAKDGVTEAYPLVGNGQSSLHLANLRKEFAVSGTDEKKVAVDNMDLKLFPNQVTVLLGHNGAGKTTTINMLTGMLEISGGDCIVYGKSVKKNLDEARAEIGFCPQHNILWPSLTCLEHLVFYAKLKGCQAAGGKGSNVEAQALHMLRQVDLLPQKDQFAGSLSGGQKRKLSVAIAFIGGSRLVLLDEPTAGMDVSARRHTWDLVRQMASDPIAARTIVLTTHFMDEADLLGNRIAIMSKGRLHSYGTPMFLKTRLGSGYVLKVSLHASASTEATDATAEALLKTIQTIIPQTAIKECKGQELSYALPVNANDDAASSAAFLGVMRTLEDDQLKARFNVSGVSLSASTIEDVFLKIAHDEELGEVNATSADVVESPTNLEAENKKKAVVFEALDAVFTMQKTNSGVAASSVGTQLRGMLWKRLNNARRDRRTICLQVVLPLIAICFAMLLGSLGPPEQPRLVVTEEMYGTPQLMTIGNCTDNPFTGHLNPEYSFENIDSISGLDNSAYGTSEHLLNTAKSTGDKERNVAIQCHDPYMSARPSNTTSPTVLLFTNASAWHSLPQVLNEYYQGAIRSWGDNTASFVLRLANNPLPWGARQEAGLDSFRSLIIGFFILIPFTFVPSTFVAWVVKERECKAKHLQFVSGANFIAYWLANYLFDFCSFIITECVAVIIFVIFGRDEFIGSGESIACIFTLFSLYGISSIASSYAISFAFEKHGTAQNVVLMGNFLCGFILVITVFILERIDSTKDAAEGLVYLFRLVPSYCLGEGILALSLAPLQSTLGQGDVSVFDLNEAGWAMIYMVLSFLLCTGITIFLDHPSRAHANQELFFKPDELPPKLLNEDPDVTNERLEVETNAEHRRTDVVRVQNLRKVYETATSGGHSKKDGDNQNIPATEKVAVKNLSFGVKKGEVFGFLGTNGAGKTTTMSILTGEFLPTNGHLTVQGFDVVTATAEARQRIGYCPQFDALLDLLTCDEHLRLFAALRGIPADVTQQLVDALITACDLQDHRRTLSKKLSGGNKRKLSVAISLIGGPPIVILDEPSAGMDPVARRHLWDVILYITKKTGSSSSPTGSSVVSPTSPRSPSGQGPGCSVVLTTHHLEEVDVLAHRVAMMVDGEMRCIGSLDHLKRKFGGDVEITVKVGGPEDDLAEVEKAKGFIVSKFPAAQLLEDRQRRLTYSIATSGRHSSTKLSTVFEILQIAKQQSGTNNPTALKIVDFVVQQSSLERVFMHISSQEDEDRDENDELESKTRNPHAEREAFTSLSPPPAQNVPLMTVGAFEDPATPTHIPANSNPLSRQNSARVVVKKSTIDLNDL